MSAPAGGGSSFCRRQNKTKQNKKWALAQRGSPESLPKLLITGSCGLIGSEVSAFFARNQFQIIGIDDNHRAEFFGPEGKQTGGRGRLRGGTLGDRGSTPVFRKRGAARALGDEVRPDLIVHTAAQPSHDRAAAIPFDDFDANAVGTLNLLEAARRLPGVAVRPHVHEQGVRRPAQHHRAEGARRAGTTPTRPSRTASRRPSRSTSPSIRSSARRRWRPT